MQKQIEYELTKEQQKELFVEPGFVMPDEIYDNQFNCMDWFINDDYKARWIVHHLLSQNAGDNIEEALKDYRDYNKLKNLNSKNYNSNLPKVHGTPSSNLSNLYGPTSLGGDTIKSLLKN